MTTRTLVALFETATAARLAADDLAAIGVDREAVAVADGPGALPAGPLGGFLLPEPDSRACEEGLRRGGGALVVARVPEVRVDLAIDALDGAGAVDIDERAPGVVGVRAAPAPEGAPGGRRHLRREVGRGAGRVRSYYDPVDIDERTVGRPGSDPMGLNMSHPARHGGL